MEKLSLEEGQGDWGKVDNDEVKEGEDEQNEEQMDDPYSFDDFTVDLDSKDKPKIVIESKLSKPENVLLDKDKYNQFFYGRENFTRFIEKLFEHPRAVVVFVTSKNKKNATEIFNNIKQYLEREFESDDDNCIKHLWNTFMYQENSSVTHKFDDAREDKVRDISKMVEVIESYYDREGKKVTIDPKNFICIETEKQKMVNYPDNLLYVPELNEKTIIQHLNSKYIGDSDEEKKEEYDEENKDQLNDNDVNRYLEEEKSKLYQILELLYKALNETDDVIQFLKDNNLGDFQNTGEEGYVKTTTMFSYPDIDIEQLKKHPTISWLFETA